MTDDIRHAISKIQRVSSFVFFVIIHPKEERGHTPVVSSKGIHDFNNQPTTRTLWNWNLDFTSTWLIEDIRMERIQVLRQRLEEFCDIHIEPPIEARLVVRVLLETFQDSLFCLRRRNIPMETQAYVHYVDLQVRTYIARSFLVHLNQNLLPATGTILSFFILYFSFITANNTACNIVQR